MTIDWWTLGFQTVNVAILIWLLGHFFWKPVAGMIEARRAATQQLTDDAQATRAKAAEALADVEKTRAGFAAEREAMIADAHKTADAAQTALLATAKTNVQALEAAAKAGIAKDTKAQEKVWSDRSIELAVAVAGHLAARLGDAVVQACFLDWLLDEIRKLPDPARQAAGAKDMRLEVRTATRLDATERKNYCKSIADALGGDPHLAFRTDQKLIAGIEVHGEHLIVRSSWRADLATIKAQLTHDHAA